MVLARQDGYADALAGAPLAALLDAPLLLAAPDGLPPATAEEIARLGAEEVVLLGGEAALSPEVEAAARAAGAASVRRLAGADRFATAARIAEEIGPVPSAYVTRGVDEGEQPGWPDAVAVGALAARQGRPILLATKDGVPPATMEALSEAGAEEVTLVGGTAALSPVVERAIAETGARVTRLAGPTRTAYRGRRREGDRRRWGRPRQAVVRHCW